MVGWRASMPRFRALRPQLPSLHGSKTPSRQTGANPPRADGAVSLCTLAPHSYGRITPDASEPHTVREDREDAPPPGTTGSPYRQHLALARRVADFLLHLSIERGLSANTVDAYRRDLHQFCEFAVSVGLDDPAAITQDEIDRFHPPEAEESGAGERRTQLAALRTFYKFLCREGHAQGSPAATAVQPRIARRIPGTLSTAEVDALLNAPDMHTPNGVRDRAMLETLLLDRNAHLRDPHPFDWPIWTWERDGCAASGRALKSAWSPSGEPPRSASISTPGAGAPVLGGARAPRSCSHRSRAAFSRSGFWR